MVFVDVLRPQVEVPAETESPACFLEAFAAPQREPGLTRSG